MIKIESEIIFKCEICESQPAFRCGYVSNDFCTAIVCRKHYHNHPPLITPYELKKSEIAVENSWEKNR